MEIWPLRANMVRMITPHPPSPRMSNGTVQEMVSCLNILIYMCMHPMFLSREQWTISLGYSWTSDWANGSSTCNKDLQGVQSCDEWMPDFAGGPDLHFSSKVRKLNTFWDERFRLFPPGIDVREVETTSVKASMSDLHHGPPAIKAMILVPSSAVRDMDWILSCKDLNWPALTLSDMEPMHFEASVKNLCTAAISAHKASTMMRNSTMSWWWDAKGLKYHKPTWKNNMQCINQTHIHSCSAFVIRKKHATGCTKSHAYVKVQFRWATLLGMN